MHSCLDEVLTVDLVIDTATLIAVIADEPERSALIRYSIGSTLYAPSSVPWEVGNACSAMVRRRRITLEQAQKAISTFNQIPVKYVDVNVSAALADSEMPNVYAYDAYIIEAAKQRQCPLLTLDRSLFFAAKQAGVETVEV